MLYFLEVKIQIYEVRHKKFKMFNKPKSSAKINQKGTLNQWRRGVRYSRGFDIYN